MGKKVVMLVAAFALSILVVACTQAEDKAVEGWQESPLFTVDNLYTMIGEEGRIGFIYDDETTKFYPDKVNKYMWHFWGKENEFDGDLTVKATSGQSGEEITLLEGVPLAGPNNGADRHIPSNLSLPESGMWKLDAYIGNEPFGTIFVKVHK